MKKVATFYRKWMIKSLVLQKQLHLNKNKTKKTNFLEKNPKKHVIYVPDGMY